MQLNRKSRWLCGCTSTSIKGACYSGRYMQASHSDLRRYVLCVLHSICCYCCCCEPHIYIKIYQHYVALITETFAKEHADGKKLRAAQSIELLPHCDFLEISFSRKRVDVIK